MAKCPTCGSEDRHLRKWYIEKDVNVERWCGDTWHDDDVMRQPNIDVRCLTMGKWYWVWPAKDSRPVPVLCEGAEYFPYVYAVRLRPIEEPQNLEEICG